MAGIRPDDEDPEERSDFLVRGSGSSAGETDSQEPYSPIPLAKSRLQPVLAAASDYVDLFRFNPDAYIITTVTDRTVLEVNPGFTQLTGYSRETAIGRTMTELGLWVDSAAHAQCVRELNSGVPGYRQLEYVDASHHRKIGSVSVEIVTVDEYPVLLTIVRDVSQYQRELNSLRIRGRQLQAFTAIASIAVQVKSLPAALRAMLKQLRRVTGFPVAIVETYDSAREIVQFSAAEGVAFSDDTVVEFPADSTISGQVARSQEAILRLGMESISEGELPLLATYPSLGTVICMPMIGGEGLFGTLTLVHPRVLSAKPGFLDWLQTISNYIATYAQKTLREDRLQHTAFHDPLTGLPNRTLFEDRVERALARTKRDSESSFAILFLDLDDFKQINDTFGHAVGDRLLEALARRLETVLRPGDSFSRLGGDEFTFLLDGIHHVTDVSRIAERILGQISQPFTIEDQEITISASIGIALASSVYEKPEELLRDADTAMYRAKNGGKAGYAIFDPMMHRDAQAQLQLEAELRQAILNHQLRIHYQPIVSLKTGKIEGLEALVRWQHPLRGLLSPQDFLAIAEDSSIVEQIDRWMLDEVCLQMHAWQQQSSGRSIPPTAINFSAKKLQNPRLTSYINRALNESELSPQYLQLEFTEGALSQVSETITAALKRLQAIGIKAAIDDFGTGFLPISKLYGFPVDRIKIDRSFVSEIEQGGENLSIVRTLATLARQLGLSVTAEGVETAEQLSLLRAVGCESGQGYFFSKPLAGDRIWELVSSDPHW